jgi:hypothetical protein
MVVPFFIRMRRLKAALSSTPKPKLLVAGARDAFAAQTASTICRRTQST